MKATSDGVSSGRENREKLQDLFGKLQKTVPRRKAGARPSQSPRPSMENGGQRTGERAPIEPAGPSRAFGILRLVLFIVAVIWVLAGVYKAPILAAVGQFLIVSHPLEQADLVVCLGGNPVDRGLEAAELVKEGYAPRIFISREEPPDAIDVLRSRGVDFPEDYELTYEMLEALGLLEESLIISEDPVSSTAEEAEQMQRLAIAEGFSCLIVVTSPQHSRRAWMAFRHVFKDSGVSVSIRPSRFSAFEPENWWKKHRYARQVVLEYMKILWYLWVL
jgi:uncharacterized SAM-binding protein YcdF (DUF218 family)